MKRVAVVGRGIAGAAAVFAARRAGAEVSSFGLVPLASGYTSGAIDDELWDVPQTAGPLDAGVRAFFDELGGYRFPDERRALVATVAGVLRPARGHDEQVLDLGSPALRGRVVAVPRVRRPGWDGDFLARSLSEEREAVAAELRFEAVDVALLRRADEETMTDGDLAARFEEPGRRAWSEARLASLSHDQYGGLLLPPGLDATRADPEGGWFAGETLSSLGGPAGDRLTNALVRVLPGARGPFVTVSERVSSDAAEAGGFDVRWADASLPFDAVVLAVGGLLGGGIAFERTDPAQMLSPIPTFSAPVFAEALLGPFADARETGAVGLPLGQILWTRGGPGPLERVGILHQGGAVLRDRDGLVAGLFVAGDAAAGRPRTILSAVRAGLRAGAAAAG